jgi:hypothetical protein
MGPTATSLALVDLGPVDSGGPLVEMAALEPVDSGAGVGLEVIEKLK